MTGLFFSFIQKKWQWGKTSSDKLGWLIRYYEETRALMLAARIPGSEWDPNH